MHSVSFDTVVIDVGGVGYGVHMTLGETARLNARQDIEVWITEIVREQSFDLFGFVSLQQQAIFEQLIKISGVGPRLGLALLGLGDTADLFRAVSMEDVAYLTRAPGVGKKLAERLIVELKDKVDMVDLNGEPQASGGNQIEAESALAALGFKTDDIRSMLKDVDRSAPVEEQVKTALTRR